MLIGNQQTQVEKTQNHFTYQGTGTRTTFACTYSDNAVLVFLNGIKDDAMPGLLRRKA